MNIIRDESLAPYEVHIDEFNYSVVKPTGRINKSTGNERYEGKSHHSTLRGAVKSIIKLKAVDEATEETLLDYVKRFENVAESIISRLSI